MAYQKRMLLKGNESATSEAVVTPEAPVAVEETVAEVAPLAEDEVVVDIEPAAEVPAVVEEVVEENPETTADEGETVVE